jgi:tetratricopeptide (TPR) repeat protein
MRSAPITAIVALAIPLALLLPRASVAAGSEAPSGSCNVASGGIGSGGNTVTCNFGMPPEQLKATIEAAVNGRLIDRIVDISKTLGVTEDAAKSLLKIVGEDSNIPEDKLAEALSKAAEDYKRLQVQIAALNPENPTAKALVQQAKPEIDAGHFARAHELLHQASQAQIAAAQEARKLKEQAQAADDAQMFGAASSTAAEGDVALTERHYVDAAELFAQAASYIPSGHPSDEGQYLLRQAGALYQQGDERGDNAALRKSIEISRRALADCPRERVPLAWAGAQNNLGNALERLGEREGGTVRLEEAVAAHHAALEEWTRERVPLDWAMTQMNLGNALERLGERESGTARLEESVVAYRSALEEKHARAGSARLGDDAEQSRPCA